MSLYQEVCMEISKNIDLVSYLQEGKIDEFLILDKKWPIHFHWSNWENTCLFQRSNLHKDKNNEKRCTDLCKGLEELKNVELFFRFKGVTLKKSLFDLYENFVEDKLKLLWFSSEENEIQISFTNISGPYISLTSLRWFDPEIFRKFIFRKILTRQMDLRNFRINSELPVNCYFSDSVGDHENVKLHQISKSGLLFKIRGNSTLVKFQNSKIIKLQLNLSPFMQGAQERIISIFVDNSIMNINRNTRNNKMNSFQEYFLFIGFKDFDENFHFKGLESIFVPYLENLENNFSDQLEIFHNLEGKKAGNTSF